MKHISLAGRTLVVGLLLLNLGAISCAPKVDPVGGGAPSPAPEFDGRYYYADGTPKPESMWPKVPAPAATPSPAPVTVPAYNCPAGSPAKLPSSGNLLGTDEVSWITAGVWLDSETPQWGTKTDPDRPYRINLTPKATGYLQYVTGPTWFDARGNEFHCPIQYEIKQAAILKCNECGKANFTIETLLVLESTGFSDAFNYVPQCRSYLEEVESRQANCGPDKVIFNFYKADDGKLVFVDVNREARYQHE